MLVAADSLSLCACFQRWPSSSPCPSLMRNVCSASAFLRCWDTLWASPTLCSSTWSSCFWVRHPLTHYLSFSKLQLMSYFHCLVQLDSFQLTFCARYFLYFLFSLWIVPPQWRQDSLLIAIAMLCQTVVTSTSMQHSLHPFILQPNRNVCTSSVVQHC